MFIWIMLFTFKCLFYYILSKLNPNKMKRVPSLIGMRERPFPFFLYFSIELSFFLDLVRQNVLHACIRASHRMK